jgi:hypothetical protein
MRLALSLSTSLLLAAGCADAAATLDAGGPDALTGADALTGDANDSDATGEATRPLVTGIAVPDHPADLVALGIGVRDTSSPTVDLRIRFACDDAPAWAPITTPDPITDLAAGPMPITHAVRWDSQTDVDLHADHDCRVAVVAIDPTGISSEPLVAAIALRRDAPPPATR